MHLPLIESQPRCKALCGEGPGRGMGMIFASSSHEKFPLENQILFLCAKKQGGVNSLIVFLSLRGNVSVVTSYAKMSRHLFEG